MDLSFIRDVEIKHPQKKIKSNCNHILKKFSPKSARDLGHFAELITVLYLYEAYDDAVQVCDLLNDIQFHGNYTVWDNVENCRLVKARILYKRGDICGADRVLATVMPFENKDVWTRQPKCLETYNVNIDEAKKRNSKSDIVSWELIKLEMLIRFAELPGYPIDKAWLDKEIEDLSKSLRLLIS